MGIDIVEARHPALRRAVFAFRYDIYVREMARSQKDADHGAGMIEDALDASAVLLAARIGGHGSVVGTVRGNVAGDGPVGPYEELYGLHRLSRAERAATSLTTRMMIARRWRGTSVAVELASALYVRGLQRAVAVDYIDCNAHLVPFFERLGYRALRLIDHEDYGRVTLMKLDLDDIDHLRRVGSPFAASYDEYMRERPPAHAGTSLET